MSRDGGPGAPPPTDADLAAAREALERTLANAGAALDEEALWLEPEAALEDAVADAVSAPVEAPRPAWRSWPAMVAAAAVVLAVVAVAAIVAARPAAPDWEVALAGTDAAPGASAIARGWNEASGTRMQLDVSGLDRAPDGFVYELWLSEGPVHVSAGTFRSAEDVQLWVGVRRSDYPRVWITLEPIDDDPRPARNILDTGPST